MKFRKISIVIYVVMIAFTLYAASSSAKPLSKGVKKGKSHSMKHDGGKTSGARPNASPSGDVSEGKFLDFMTSEIIRIMDTLPLATIASIKVFQTFPRCKCIMCVGSK